MSSALGLLLAVAALVLGYGLYGGPGVALAATVVAFALLLQFSQALRVLRAAGARPVGSVASAVMLQARLRRGMRMPAVLRLTGSLGQRVTAEPDTWVWQDVGGDQVQVRLVGGRVHDWQLQRAATGAGQGPAA